MEIKNKNFVIILEFNAVSVRVAGNGKGLDVAAFENRQPVTAAKFINKSSLFILLLCVIRLEQKPNSEIKKKNLQNESCRFSFYKT